MSDIAATVALNIQRIRKLRQLSQKEIAVAISMPQGQYSRIENGKVVATLPTLQKIAEVFSVSVAELLREDTASTEEVDLPLLEKIRLLDTLEEKEKGAILTVIDIALSAKRLKNSLAQLMA